MPNSISSLSGHHPTVWATANQPAAAAASSKDYFLPSPAFLRRQHTHKRKNRHLHTSLPNWTRLSGSHEDDTNPTQPDQLLEQTDNQSQLLAVTYSSPQTASEAYKCGLLKSDYSISSNALRIRLAFRYHLTLQLQHDGDKISASGNEHDDDDLLYLCWVSQDGIPHHFRKLTPVQKNSDNDSKSELKSRMVEGHASIVQADDSEQNDNSNGESDGLFVNEHDKIESTFPGHAFVFCRRIAYYDHGQTTTDNDDDINSSPRVVENESGHTIILRRKTKERHNDVKKEESSILSSEIEDKPHKGGKGTQNEDDNHCNNEDDDWEAYLVVGGFRPGPMPRPSSSPVVKDDASDIRAESDEVETTSNDGDSTDDDSDDEMELQVQLVTIRRVKMSNARGNPQDHATTSLLRGSDVTASASSSSSQLDQILDDMKVTVYLAQIDPTPVDVSSKHYDHVTLGGWPCRIEPGCFQSSETERPENGRLPLQSRFETDIAAACQSLPPIAREKLQQSTPIWINKSHMWGPKVAPVRGRDACFHPGANWLSRNGDNPLKCGSVEFYDAKHYLSDCDHWGIGGLILHELSHAWHNIHIENGYDNKQIKECYDLAMKDGLYDCVRVHGPQGPECKAYACTNAMEYFAELSVAFLGGLDDTFEHNKWFPFNRSQLRDHDPRAFDMLCQMWGVVVVEEDVDNDNENKSGE